MLFVLILIVNKLLGARELYDLAILAMVRASLFKVIAKILHPLKRSIPSLLGCLRWILAKLDHTLPVFGP